MIQSFLKRMEGYLWNTGAVFPRDPSNMKKLQLTGLGESSNLGGLQTHCLAVLGSLWLEQAWRRAGSNRLPPEPSPPWDSVSRYVSASLSRLQKMHQQSPVLHRDWRTCKTSVPVAQPLSTPHGAHVSAPALCTNGSIIHHVILNALVQCKCSSRKCRL